MRAKLPALDAALRVAEEFVGMVRKTVTQSLADWLAKAASSGVPELVNFAVGLQSDEAAVNAALTTAWSNGQVEGQVNRLKAKKGAMFGRAGMRLLRARVVRKG